MTVLSLLNGTWEYQFEDESDVGATTGTRMIKYNHGPVITTNDLYSAIAGATDEFQAMGFKNPMLPVTPNQFTLENQAFISRASTEKLKEGTIRANWTINDSVDTDGNGVYRVPYTPDTPFTSADIGMEVNQTTSLDSGTLLDFEVEPDGTSVLWIRPDDCSAGGDLFATTEVITSDGGGVTAATVAATNGWSTYTAIQAIGSVPTATEVYVVQDRIKLANSVSAAGFQFWGTDPSIALGIISVLIRTQNAESDADYTADADLEVFARKYGALYDNFRLRVVAGGFSALPLASAPDVNNTTGYRTVIGDNDATGTWTVGNAIYSGLSEADQVWTYDLSTTTFADVTTDFNDAGADDVLPFPASNEIGDYFVIGFDKPFSEVVIDIGTQVGLTGTLDWQYWDGAWQDMDSEDDTSTGFTDGTDTYRITWDIGLQVGWIRNIINDGESLYYIRAIVSDEYETAPDITQGWIGGYSAAAKKGVITGGGVGTLTGTDPEIEYYPIGDLSAFAVSDEIYEWNFTLGADTAANFMTAEAPFDKVAGPAGANSAAITITQQAVGADWTGDGTNEPYSITIDCNAQAVANVYERLKFVCRRGQDDGFWANTCLIPGEQWRGIEAAVYYDDPQVSDFTEGENITSTNWTARVIGDGDTGEGTYEGMAQIYITVADQQTSIESLADNEIITGVSSSGTVVVDTSAGAGGSIVTHASIKAAPFGSFTGTQVFGAPGVYFTNLGVGDSQAYLLTDDLGNPREAPNLVAFTVTNLWAQDRIFVARDDSNGGVIDKDQHGGVAANTDLADTEVICANVLDSAVPAVGFIRIVDLSTQQEHKYWYDSIDRAAKTFTLNTVTNSAAQATTTTTLLVGDATTWDTGTPTEARVGMLIVTDKSEYYEIVTVTDDTHLVIRQVFGSNGTFEPGDTFTINQLIVNYVNPDDKIYDLLLDKESLTGSLGAENSESNSFVYTGSFGTVVQVRHGGDILPFQQNATVEGATSVTAVRAADTIA